ncbi:MAG: sugar phosphate isomerase/epimerase family protein [Limisphaerales bacterium]
MTQINRRNALQILGAGSLVAAAPSIGFAASDKMKLSIAAYSFRDHFGYMKGKERKAAEPKITMREFLDFCAENNAGAELTSYFFPPNVDAKMCRGLRKYAKKKGIGISGTAVGNNFSYEPAKDRKEQMDYVKKWIDHAAQMGGPHVRIFAGKKRKETSEEKADKLVIEALQEACEYAGEKKVYLGLENHDSISTAERLIRLIKAVDSKWLGVNLDSGNFRTDDPYKDFELSAPYAVNVQLKADIRFPGKAAEPADLKRLMNLLKKANYKDWVALEYELKKDPFTEIPPLMKELAALA